MSSLRDVLIPKLLKGELILGGMDEEALSNLNCAVVDLYKDWGDSGNVLIDNPLGREPIGCLSLGFGIAYRQPASYDTDLDFTQGSKVVTCTASTFPTTFEKGHIAAPGSANAPEWFSKIVSRDNATQITMQDTWTTASEAGISGCCFHRWHSDTLYLYLGITSSAAHARVLLF